MAAMENSPSIGCVFIVLPAYNEQQHIGRLIESIHAVMTAVLRNYRVVVVDDGSADGTGAIVARLAADLPVTLLAHERNQGLGVSIRDGIAVAAQSASPADVIVTMDADETQPPECIPEMVAALHRGCDVVIASRYRPGSKTIGVPVHRQMLSLGASLLMRVRFPIKGVRDYTCGFRAYRANVIHRALGVYGESFCDRAGFECMVDILLKLRAIKPVFGEIPFVLNYDRRGKESKMRVSRTILETLRLVGRQARRAR